MCEGKDSVLLRMPWHLFSSPQSWALLLWLLVWSTWPLAKEASERTCAREEEKGGLPGVCVPQPLPTSQNPNLLQPFWGAGGRGSNTLAGTELPPSCYRPRSSRSSYQNSEAWGCVEMVCSTVGECVRSPAGPINDCVRVTVLRKRQRP